MIRQPIITVLGHVDHGKTSLLDSIRATKIVNKESGAITQHIGATEIPLESIQKICGELIEKFGFKLKIPGLLVIDTPGHEAFTNLRKRGGSIADLAILVIDSMQGIQPQTKEAINILKINKVPFIIAMNKIDLIQKYDSREGSFIKNFNTQKEETKTILDQKLYEIVGKIFEEGFQSERFDRCEFGKQIPIVPCSSKTKEGLPEILTLLSGLSQKYLEKDLEIDKNEKGKATVLEAKEETGLGKTIDIILYQGNIKINDEIAVLGKNGIIKTKIRTLLQPKPLQEMMNTKEKFSKVKEAFAATGIKISAPNLENVLVGSTLIVLKNEDDVKELEEEAKKSFITTDDKGVIIKADAIGSLEAIIELFKKNNILIKKAEIGNVNRKDIMEANTIACEDPYLGVVIGFNVKTEKDAEKEANIREINIFNEKVIYKLIDEYLNWVNKNKKLEKEKSFSCLILPVKIKVLKGKVFRNKKPAIIGVKIEEGRLKEGWKIINEKGDIIGKIIGLQNDGKKIVEAKKGLELAIAIEEGQVGKNIFEGETLYSCIPAKQYCEINKYLEDFSEEEKKLLEEIKLKNNK